MAQPEEQTGNIICAVFVLPIIDTDTSLYKEEVDHAVSNLVPQDSQKRILAKPIHHLRKEHRIIHQPAG